MSLDELIDDNIRKTVEASEDPKETIRQLSNQLSRRIKQLEDEYWERARFCDCGADSIVECGCEGKAGYMERTNRKINDDLGQLTGFTIAALKQEYGVTIDKSQKIGGDNE